MNYIWLFLLPLLYLPNLSYSSATDFGTLGISDYFVGPLLIFVYLRGQATWLKRLDPYPKLFVHYLLPTFFLFLWWAGLSTITTYFRYDYGYPNTYVMNFGLFKIAKLGLYVITAFFTMRALSRASDREREGFMYSMVAAALIVGGGLLITGNSVEDPSDLTSNQLFQENGVSVLLSILISFIVGMLAKGNGTKLWRRITSLCMIVIVLGFVLANGRGGWVAAIVGLIYIGSRIHLKYTIRIIIVASLFITYAYNEFPTFSELIDSTLEPNKAEGFSSNIAGVSDGGRSAIFQSQFIGIFDEPVFGRGIFHRGGLSGTYSTGSHNFFLQMFIEVGIPGGILVFIILRQMWLHASSPIAKKHNLEVPVKAAMVAAFIGGNSGEYFYGGMALFTLFMTYALVGSLRQDENEAIISENRINKIKPAFEK